MALIGVALAVTVGGAFAHSTGATPLPAATCSAIQNPDGNLLLASDLPLQGAGRSQTIQMTKAIAFELAQHGWKAGNYTLAYQSCDDSTAQAGKWDSGTCSTNAGNYASDSSVVGVVGTFNSGCAEIEIPIENRAPNGPLAMVSPANTYVGLTHSGPGTAAGEPGKYYPTGKRNYARVVAADDFQGAADATLAQKLHVKKLFVLNDKEAYGQGVATNTANAAKKLGITVVKDVAWDPKATSYSALALQIAHSGATAVFLGGLICENGGKLIKDIRAGAPNVTILAPDGFTPVSADVQQSSGKANGMYVSVAGLPNEKLPAAGKAFVKAFGKTQSGGQVDPYSVYAAQAADVIIAAVAASDGTRAGVASALYKVNIPNGILGPMAFNQNGDVSANPVSIYKVVGGKSTTYQVIVPKNSLVAAA
ncbi:MAG TPA: branched-chain amino acid ABC transporter substrate-binding protein [Gaiellaceae bacterium]|nr:branched-chain amino acid ABC transporter substrate-binding protein [Gaiellaceae bacterium]